MLAAAETDALNNDALDDDIENSIGGLRRIRKSLYGPKINTNMT